MTDNQEVENILINNEHISKKILIMDDEPSICKFLSIVLKKLGYLFEVTTNGLEAINSVKNNLENNDPFDILIMDMTIKGGMGGVEAITQIREIQPDVKIIISSGYSESFASCRISENSL